MRSRKVGVTLQAKVRKITMERERRREREKKREKERERQRERETNREADRRKEIEREIMKERYARYLVFLVGWLVCHYFLMGR